ncbi:MAG: hypothetical protein AAF655_12880 [Bacteroidota bacterium]
MNVGNKLFSACCWTVFRDFLGMETPELAIFEEPTSDSEKELIQFAIELAVGRRRVAADSWSALRPVLQLVGQNRQDVSDAFILPAKLSLEKGAFPFPKETILEDYQKQAIDHLTSCLQELAKIQSDLHPDSVLSFFEAQLTTLPCRYGHIEDVSLYDHLKSVIAFADCLQTYLNHTQKSLEEIRNDPDAQPFRMVGADISGIQKFIYDIVSKNAAKNLKGRSFYLDLLVDSVIQRLLQEFRLYTAHIIYASGGGFYVLAPNLPTLKNELSTFRKAVQEKLLALHAGSLFLALGSIGMKLGHLFADVSADKEQTISGYWIELLGELNAQKKRRFANELVDQFEEFFLPIEIGGRTVRDVITDEELTEEEERQHDEKMASGSLDRFGDLVCFLDVGPNPQTGTESLLEPVKTGTYKQILLGRELRETDYWLSTIEPVAFTTSVRPRKKKLVEAFEPCELGIYHYFLTEAELEENKLKIPGQARILSVNTPSLNILSNQLPSRKLGFTFYGGNRFPMGNEFPLETEALVGEREFRRMGLLRMDVDNLGQLFIRGFENKPKTFSRFAALSRSLDYFFKGYLNTILHPYVKETEKDEKDKEKKSAYILYSGGDDLFILGHWLDIMEIASEIRQKFKELTFHNPKVSLSGGLSILTPKFPIMLGASYAARAEKKAKGHKYFTNNGLQSEKNAFTFLHKPLNWEWEFPMVEEIKTKLLRFVSPDHGGKKALLSDNLLARIQQHAKSQEKQRAEGSTEKWYWNLMYDLSQAQSRVKKPTAKPGSEEQQAYEAATSFLNTLIIKAVKEEYKVSQPTNYTYLQLMALAARWANMELRTHKMSVTNGEENE